MSILNEDMLKEIASGCYVCKNAKCKKHCPISTDIPTVIELYKNGEIEKAGEVLFNNNPLSVVCCNVCPHEDFCLGNCIKNIKGDSVKFYEIEKFISTKYIENIKLKKEKVIDKKVAVIGGGPAGIAMALILGQKGYNITIFEKNEDLGGVLKYGIPHYRLDLKIIKKYKEILKELGVKIRYNTLIGHELNIDTLVNDGYDAIYIGTGVWRARALGLKGESYGNVHYAINYLKDPSNYNLGDDIVIIGAGNVAMDAGRVAKRQGAKNVTVVYRKDYSDMVATQVEIDEAIEDGVKFEFFKAPVEIKEDGVVFSDTVAFTNEKGQRDCKNVDNSEKFKKADSVIIAVGQMPLKNIVSTTNGIETNKGGYLVVNENNETTRAGIFAGGDVVTGASTVVEVVANTKIVASNIEDFLQNNK